MAGLIETFTCNRGRHALELIATTTDTYTLVMHCIRCDNVFEDVHFYPE